MNEYILNVNLVFYNGKEKNIWELYVERFLMSLLNIEM